MTTKEMENVLTLIGKSDFEQITKIAERLKLQRTFVQNQNRRSLVIGDTVEFVVHGPWTTAMLLKLIPKISLFAKITVTDFQQVGKFLLRC